MHEYNDANYPLVSAIVLCYKHEKFVIECLESVKAQNYPNLEVIVHDDASPDDSAGVIQAWLSKCGLLASFHRQERNQGICRSLNHALLHAKGKYVSVIAADDVWLPHKLLTQVEMFERLPQNVGVIYSDAQEMNEEGEIFDRLFIAGGNRFSAIPEGNIHRDLWVGNFIPVMTTLVKRDCYAKVGNFDESLFYEDWDMWLRISRSFDFAYSPLVSARYRFLTTSMTRMQRPRMLDSTCQMCLKHIKQGEMSREIKRLAISHFFNNAFESHRLRTPLHKRNLIQAMRMASLDAQAASALWAIFQRRLTSASVRIKALLSHH